MQKPSRTSSCSSIAVPSNVERRSRFHMPDISTAPMTPPSSSRLIAAFDATADRA